MKQLMVVLFFCGTLTATGQTVKWGRLQQKPDQNVHISELIGKTPVGIFTLLTDMRIPAILPPFLQRFNVDLKLEKQVPLRLRSKYGNLNLEKVMVLGDRLYLLGSVGKQGTRVRACVQEIDQVTLQSKHEPKLIPEINWVEGLMEVPLGIKISADQSKMLIYNYFPSTPENFTRNWLLVFDAQMNCLWSTSAEKSQLDKNLLLLDYEIANDGKVMVLTKEKQRAGKELSLVVMQYGNNGQKTNQYTIPLAQNHLQQAHLQLDKQGRLICAGFLNDGYNETTSSFASVIDLNAEVVKTQITPFHAAELNALDGQPKKLLDYQMRKLHVTSTARIVLLAEQFLPPSFDRNKQAFYGQVLMVSYPVDLGTPYLFNLDKNQHSLDRGYFDSFTFVAKNEHHILLYNDKGNPPMRKTSFAPTGMENTKLESPSNAKIKVRPQNCASLSDQVLWIYAETEDKKHYQVGLLEF